MIRFAVVAALGLAFAVAGGAAAFAGEDGRSGYAIGDRIETRGLISQDGTPFRFADGTARSVALSFIYTNCRDADGCPTVSARFAKLQARVDRRSVRLVLVTIAPREDTAAVLRRYARAFDADPARWTFVTGDVNAITTLAQRFGIVGAERNPDGALDHAERLVILDGEGRIAEMIPGATWDVDDAQTAIAAVAGLASNPLRSAAVHFTWSIEHTCGVQRTGVGISLHHAGFAALFALPPGPLVALLYAERRRRRFERKARL